MLCMETPHSPPPPPAHKEHHFTELFEEINCVMGETNEQTNKIAAHFSPEIYKQENTVEKSNMAVF